MWIRIGVTVRKRLNGVMTSVTLTFDLWPWPFAWSSCMSMVITPDNFRIIWWEEHCQKQTDRWKEVFLELLGRSWKYIYVYHSIYPFHIKISAHYGLLSLNNIQLSTKWFKKWSGPFFLHGLTLILAWTSNYIHDSLRGNYFTVSKLQWHKWMCNCISLSYNGCYYLSMPNLN